MTLVCRARFGALVTILMLLPLQAAYAGYYHYVWPYDGAVMTGSWGTVKGWANAKANAYWSPSIPGVNCIWLSDEPDPPASTTGPWGGNKCGGQFTVTYVDELCPSGLTLESGVCHAPPGEVSPGVNQGSGKDDPGPCSYDSNPIRIATGNKYQVETDYRGKRSSGLTFERSYNSQSTLFGVLGNRWSAKWWARLDLHTTGDLAILYRPDGQTLTFTNAQGGWLVENRGPGELTEQVDINGARTGWRYAAPDGSIELYDEGGRFRSLTDRQRRVYSFDYNGDGELSSVADAFGRTLSFTYDSSGRIVSMLDPAANLYTYAYDSLSNLHEVTYPDDTPADDTDNPTRVYHYEDARHPHALTGITDENEVRYTTYAYDASGRAVSSAHAGDTNRSTFDYTFADDPVDPRVTVKNPLLKDTTYHFQTLSGARKITTVEGHATPTCAAANRSTTYDENGFPDRVTDWEGRVTDFEYGANGLALNRVEAQGTAAERRIETEWHPVFRVPTRIDVFDAGGLHVSRTTFTHDSAGRLLTRTESDPVAGKSRTTTHTYNQAGLLASRDGTRTDVSDVVTFSYDIEGNLIETKNALEHSARVTSHDLHGRPLVLEDPNGLMAVLGYDARGRLIRRNLGGQLTTYEYDGVSNITRVTLADDSFLVFEYDDARRLVAVEDTEGNRSEFLLDGAGNRLEETTKDGGGSTTRLRSSVFNELSRLIRDVGGAGQETELEYDLEGNRTALIDGNDERTTSEYDALNRLSKTIDPSLNETTLLYDALDNLVSIVDSEGLETAYGYDGLKSLISQTSPDTGLLRFGYDAAGNRVTETDARLVETRMVYDGLNRLVSIEYPDSSRNVGFEFDTAVHGIGRLARMTDASGSTGYVYDQRGNVVSEQRTIEGVSYVTDYGYDSVDRLASITYPSGAMVSYIRGSHGRVVNLSATIDGAAQTLASGITHLPFGPIEGLDYGNGLALAREFDLDYRLTGQSAGAAMDVTLGYDQGNNITSLIDGTDDSRSQTFDYDSSNRLTEAHGIYGTVEFSYDSIGNRLTRSSTAGLETYQYADTSHHLLSIGGVGAASLDFDANGNTRAKGSLGFVYDQTNRLTELREEGTPVVRYVYNGKGERSIKSGGTHVSSSVLFADGYEDGTVSAWQPPKKRRAVSTSFAAPISGNDTTHFVYDQTGRLLGEYDGFGGAIVEYVYLENRPFAMLRAGAVYYYHTDYLGTPQALTDQDQNVVWKADYAPFGEASVSTEIVENALRFPGQYYDSESGQHYNYSRQYDPGIGRYTQSDPIGLEAGPSTYLYVGANPVTWSDRTGLARECIFTPSPNSPPRFSPSGAFRSVDQEDYQVTLCGPLARIGAPLPPVDRRKFFRRSPLLFLLDLVASVTACQTTHYWGGYKEQLYEATVWGELRCYDDCGRLETEGLFTRRRWEPADEWRRVEGSDFEGSYDGPVRVME